MKSRIAIPQLAKVRAILQKEIGSVCPFCQNDDVGHFEIHHIDENPTNNEIGNLLLLLTTPISNKSNSEKIVNFNNNVENAFVGDNNNISIKQTKKTVKQKYPEGCIGFDTIKANYIGHLIKRYNEYKEYEVGKENMNYAAFSSHLKKRYKIGPTRTLYNLPIEKFEELTIYIQTRIDKTTLAKMKGRGHKNYSTFSEYADE